MALLPGSRDLSRAYEEGWIDVRSRGRERLDRYLQRSLGWKSRTKIQKLIELGFVELNGRELRKCAFKVSSGDRIRVRLAVDGEARPQGAAPIPPPFWEDAYLLAIDKPTGRLVHPVGRTISGTIINELHHRYALIQERGQRLVVPKLCHRLDRDTSGVLLVAKTDFARKKLQRSFDADEVKKEYLAVVGGIPDRDSWTIDHPIGEHLDREKQVGHRLSQIDPDGKPSVTDVEVLHRGAGFSLLLCRPKTGRQNQIRVHLAADGFPILGDTGYGSEPDTNTEAMFPERPLLHSRSLSFPHPCWGCMQTLSVPPPEDFRPFLRR